ncbi:hypothetical protein GOP47_0006996 [Adiantum capillus-veneris]|uniref:Uncharacterized protein n=1 Tax=Adiantum capillus-veneris TaxID=13818 RepID=A0A9D4V1A6_ADICA|nr:hypothetical protein GOP47_0006996 [Adiantum capillus-veneris]
MAPSTERDREKKKQVDESEKGLTESTREGGASTAARSIRVPPCKAIKQVDETGKPRCCEAARGVDKFSKQNSAVHCRLGKQ